VNGSTGGNLAAIFAATEQKDSIIIGRNSHKSIYHAAELRQLSVSYTYPRVSEQGIILGTPLEEYRRAIAEHPEAKAVVVTSPTYEGMIEPLEEIVALAHAHHMAVIVDGAHGAHLGFHSYFPASPLAAKPDIVVMSLHKTLPALTQTGVLHYLGQRDASGNTLISREKIEKYLSVFQTSSPSYVLMASICQCARFLQQEEKAFADYAERLQDFYRKAQGLCHLQVRLQPGQDPSKIVIETGGTGITGQELLERLHQDYELELEMASFSYALAMTSVMDTEEGMQRLWEALKEIDGELTEKQAAAENGLGQDSNHVEMSLDLSALYAPAVKVMETYEAAERPMEAVSGEESIGRIAAKEVALYPPGVPVLLPGERIGKEQITLLRQAQETGLAITGIQEGEGGQWAKFFVL
jgi:arginine/lysine/ornithine decarboxylase